MARLLHELPVVVDHIMLECGEFSSLNGSNSGSPIGRTIDRPFSGKTNESSRDSIAVRSRPDNPPSAFLTLKQNYCWFPLAAPVGLPGDSLENCAAPRPGSNGGDTSSEQRHGRESIPPPSSPPQAKTSTTPTTSTSASSSRRSSPSSSSQHQQPARRGARGSISSAGAGPTSGGNGTNGTASIAPADPAAEDHRCSLRGLVWKVLLGTIHTDSSLYTRLVRKGPSSEDVKIKEDTFRTFPRDEEFRRRVHEHKLSRINNAYVRLNRRDGGAVLAATAGAAAERRGSGGTGREEGGSSSNDNVDVGGEQQRPEADDVSGSSESTAVVGGTGAGGGGSGEKGAGRAPDGGKGVYVQGMMVLCAPLLFVMPEVDAFFCFNSLLNQHMPR